MITSVEEKDKTRTVSTANDIFFKWSLTRKRLESEHIMKAILEEAFSKKVSSLCERT